MWFVKFVYVIVSDFDNGAKTYLIIKISKLEFKKMFILVIQMWLIKYLYKMSLTLPGSGGSDSSPRRAVSPLLEVRRPHCTLNCDHCNAILEDRFKHIRKYFQNIPLWIVIIYHIRYIEGKESLWCLFYKKVDDILYTLLFTILGIYNIIYLHCTYIWNIMIFYYM